MKCELCSQAKFVQGGAPENAMIHEYGVKSRLIGDYFPGDILFSRPIFFIRE
jgi:hypothetical protein